MKKNVIILGAGASVPFGLPTGTELRDVIINSGIDGNLLNLIRRVHSNTTKDRYSFNQSIGEDLINDFRSSNTISIDSFLSNQDELHYNIGRAILSYHLLELEPKGLRNSKNSVTTKKKNLALDKEQIKISDNWIQSLLNKLNPKNRNYKDFLTNLKQLKFISFNYDRILEQNIVDHVYHSYPNVKHRWEEVKEELDEALDLTYVYGSLGDVGPIPIENEYIGIRDNRTYPYNSNSQHTSNNRAYKGAYNIDIMRDESATVDTLLPDSSEISNLFVLGFSYDQFNTKKLGLDSFFMAKPQVPIYTTAINLDPEILFKFEYFYGKRNSKVRLFENINKSPCSQTIRPLIIRSET